MSTIEATLLEQARAGDALAFEALQILLEGGLRRFMVRLVGMHPAEDDILQNTFLALYQNLPRLTTVSHMRAFLFRVVRNQCYDELRRQRRFNNVALDEDGAPPLFDPHPPPEDVTHWLLIHAEVQIAIDRLPEAQRQTLLLMAEAHLSYVEIAAATGVSLGTVKSRLHHAKKNLIKALKPATRHALGLQGEDE